MEKHARGSSEKKTSITGTGEHLLRGKNRLRKPAWAIDTPSPVKEQPALSSIQEEQLEAGPSMEQKASASTPPESDASWGDDDAFGAFEL